MSDIADELGTVLEETNQQGLQEQGERLANEEAQTHTLSSSMNMYQGVLNSSMYDVSEEGPKIIVYAHSPGFEEGEHGHGVLRGRNTKKRYAHPEGTSHRVAQSTDTKTGIIPLKVESGEYLPGPHYKDEGVVEVALEHDNMDMREDYPVNLNTIPYDPGSLNSHELQDIIDSYDGDGDGSIMREGLI